MKKMLLLLFKNIKNIKIKSIILKLIMKIDDPLLTTSRELMEKYYSIKIGKHSYGCFKLDYSIESGTIIGSYCSIAPGARIGSMNHPSQFVSTHPFLYDKSNGFVPSNIEEVIKRGSPQVVLGDDVWIGLNAIVLPGVTISKGAIVGAGAVVTKDVLPYTIVGGNPAKVIKKRFSDENIEKLLEINWTEWDKDTIKNRLSAFYNIEEFINKYSQENR